MQNNLGIIRTDSELQQGIKDIENLKEKNKNVKANGSSQFNPGWHEALAMRNLLITAEAVARAAHLRTESRGAHTRDDYTAEMIHILVNVGADIYIKDKNNFINVHLCITRTFSNLPHHWINPVGCSFKVKGGKVSNNTVFLSFSSSVEMCARLGIKETI